MLSTFIAHVREKIKETRNKPSVKKLREKFESILKKRKEVNWNNERTSGISKDVLNPEQLLYDLLIEREEVVRKEG